MLTEEVSNKTKSTISPPEPETQHRDQDRSEDGEAGLTRTEAQASVANICRISPRSDSRQTVKIIGFKYFKCDVSFLQKICTELPKPSTLIA